VKKLESIRDISDSLLSQIKYTLKIKKYTPEMENHFSDRIEKCLSCPELRENKFPTLNRSVRFCDRCKCLFPSLIFAHRKKCPIGRWDTIPEKDTGSGSREA